MTWTIQNARDVYNIAHWSNGYFDVNDRGELVCRPDPRAGHPGINLAALVRELPAHELTLPVLARFSGILAHRVQELCAAFDGAMQADGYRGNYTAVYPIKVNQQKSVVDALLTHGGERLGLEAGSKPELLAVLARSRPGGIVVCNGYKDREFIRLALIGKQLGIRVHVVVEKLSELELVIREARALGTAPLIGVRVRLSSLGAGKWQNTGGEKSKFGLSAAEVLKVIERLRAENLLDSLQMMHFHMGSQIANIQHVQAGMKEAARYYAELRKLGIEADEARLIAFRVHGVTPEFVHDVEKLGFGRPDPEQLVAMRVHGVTPAYIDKMKARGVKDLTIEQLISLRVHGID